MRRLQTTQNEGQRKRGMVTVEQTAKHSLTGGATHESFYPHERQP